jgi:hypothetical protein
MVRGLYLTHRLKHRKEQEMKRIVSLTVNVWTLFVFCAIILFGAGIAKSAAVPQAINYQAVLLDSDGDPITTPVDIVFTIYDAESGGNILWQETKYGVDPDDNGQFSLILGKTAAITDSVLTGEGRWLGIKVGTDAEITPRTELVSSAYSFRVSTVDRAKAGTIKGALTIEESLDRAADASLVLVGAMADTIQLSPADGIILRATNENGDEVMSASINQGDQTAQLSIRVDGSDQAVYSATGAEFSTSAAKTLGKKLRVGAEGLLFFGATDSDTILKIEEEIPGKASIILADHSATGKQFAPRISLGPPNTLFHNVFSDYNGSGDLLMRGAYDATGPGGSIGFWGGGPKGHHKISEIGEQGLRLFGDTEADTSVVVAGGSILLAPAGAKTGGRVLISYDGIYFLNAAKSETTMVIKADGSIVGKGKIAMGQNMVNSGNYSNALGFHNSATGDSSVCTGGYDNIAHGYASIVGAGVRNEANGTGSFVSAGHDNKANGYLSSIGGGVYNTVDSLANYATVCGGELNTAKGWWATVAGGKGCVASGWASFAAGFWSEATADNACALGRFAHAKHNGSFVWGGAGLDTFATTANDQFLVRAYSGVGINVNNPSEDLDVFGDARLRGIPSTVTVYNTVMADGNGKLWILSAKSSERYKENIRDLGVDPANVLQLDPVKFSWKETGQEDIGLIAEDVAKLIPELVIYDDQGRPDGVKYDKVVIYLLSALKELKTENDALKTQLKENNVQLSQLADLVQTILAKQNESKSGDNKMAIKR